MAEESDSSSLSEHSEKEIQEKVFPIFAKARAATKLAAPPPAVSPPRPKRAPSPPHEEVLADNFDIAFLVMFRSRFNDALPSKLPHFGPQDIERGVVDSRPSPSVEQLLCALLALVNNRKKPVERGHHGRALEEAVLSNKSQWPHKWNGVNPLHGGNSFETMAPAERLDLLRTLVMWSLNSSEAIQAIIKDKYKQQRHNDDENQPLSVQPWGYDGDKRGYYLVQGMDDTSFRVYRAGPRALKHPHWWSVAGDIDEVKELAKKLEEVDGSQAGRRMAMRMTNAVPTFEATEEKRRRREYRQVRRAAFTRPEPGFSIYEGRTRGKRMRYTYDEDDDNFLSDDTSVRRSSRQSARSTPFDSGPTVTASGRQVRQPRTGEYGESLLSGPPMTADGLAPDYSDADRATSRGRSGTEDSEGPVRGGGRSTRYRGVPQANGTDNPRKRKHLETYNDIDDMSEEDEADASGDHWDSDKNEVEDDDMPDADDEADELSDKDEASDDEDHQEVKSLILRLKVPSEALKHVENGTSTPAVRSSTAADDSTQAGAPKCEPTAEKTIVMTKAEVSGPDSSPIGPSAYPTPTSSSFLPPEQKIAVAPLPPILQPASHPLAAAQTANTGLSNGVPSSVGSTIEPSSQAGEKPNGLSASAVNPIENGNSVPSFQQ